MKSPNNLADEMTKMFLTFNNEDINANIYMCNVSKNYNADAKEIIDINTFPNLFTVERSREKDKRVEEE